MAYASHKEFSMIKKRKLEEQGEEIAKKGRTGTTEQPLTSNVPSK